MEFWGRNFHKHEINYSVSDKTTEMSFSGLVAVRTATLPLILELYSSQELLETFMAYELDGCVRTLDAMETLSQ